MKKPFSYLQDNNGNKSSKRLAGSCLIGCGLILGLILFGVGLFKEIINFPQEIQLLGFVFIMPGAGLLGTTVFEKHWRNKNVNDSME